MRTVDSSLGGAERIAWESTNHLTLEPKAYDCILIINFLGNLEFSIILIDFPRFEGCGKSLPAWNLKQVKMSGLGKINYIKLSLGIIQRKDLITLCLSQRKHLRETPITNLHF